jgi:predicted nucleotide-binding protein
MFKITGLDQITRQLEEVAKVAEALNGDLAEVKFDPLDASSVDAAIAEMESAIDAKAGAYRGNPHVDELIENTKEHFRKEILARASAARINKETPMASGSINPTIFRQIENAIADIRNSDYQTFGNAIKKLSRVLHAPELEPLTAKLCEGIDLEAWIRECEKTQGGMIGTATLDWPSDPEKELGTKILLIDKFAKEPDQALNFSHTFYYNGSKLTGNLQNMARQMIVPLARDYIDYVKRERSVNEPTLLPVRTGPAARKVFIVHGHDDGSRESVARYLERLGFEVIILHEQASRGKTIIEKIEEHGEVGFAVVLLTADDVGGKDVGTLKPRARQNVILELGYFIARLSRSRVCALKRGDVEVPSDFGGVVYTEFDDNGGWKTSLGKELEAAGFAIDWNVAMRV